MRGGRATQLASKLESSGTEVDSHTRDQSEDLHVMLPLLKSSHATDGEVRD